MVKYWRPAEKAQVGIRLFAASSLIILVLLAGCSAVSPPAPEPTASVVPVTPSEPAAAPSPEVTTPTLVHFGQDERVDLESLNDWAEAHGWIFTQEPVTALDAWTDRPGLGAVVIAGDDISMARIADFPPEARFVILEGPEFEPDERLSIVGDPEARRDQLAFLGGLMVGMATDSRSVGLLTDDENGYGPVYRMGFIHGLRFACPRCGLVEHSSSAASARAMVEARVDTALILPGPDAIDAASRMMEAGIWVVWLGIPPSDVPRERLAGWARFAPTPLILQALDAMLAGEPGGIYPYSAATDGIEFEVLQVDAISSGRRGFIERAWERIRAGELGTGVDPETGAER
jgi:hypothetical protein